jgi:hypothetical protein
MAGKVDRQQSHYKKIAIAGKARCCREKSCGACGSLLLIGPDYDAAALTVAVDPTPITLEEALAFHALGQRIVSAWTTQWGTELHDADVFYLSRPLPGRPLHKEHCCDA